VNNIENKELKHRSGFSRSPTALHFLIIAVVGLFIYSTNLNVPFLWDDADFIGKNPVVKDLAYFVEPSKAKGSGYYDALISRYFGYLSFALNYRIHGFSVEGYHIINNSIHLINAVLVYLLVSFSFRTPLIRTSSLRENSAYIALFSGLVFVAHPVQTEAVTYIYQRFASLAAMFYLLSVVMYVRWRLLREQKLSSAATQQSQFSFTALLLYCSAVLFALLAMKTKENAFTLPLMIMLYEFIFFRSGLRARVLRIAPFVIVMFVALLTLTGIDMAPLEIVGQAGALTSGFVDMPRAEYFFTQFRVMVTYVRLLFLPISQNLDYDYQLFRSFLDPEVFSSFLFLFLVFGLGIYMFRRSRRGEAAGRLVAFGIFWFFTALLVESSIIPLPMLIDEYRVYLPSVGAFTAMSVGIFMIMDRFSRNMWLKKAMVSVVIILPLVFSYAAYARNNVYANMVTLWEDIARKSPGKSRAHYNLGVAYSEKGFESKAIYHYRIALGLNPQCADTHFNIGRLYYRSGLVDRAIGHYKNALRFKPDADIHNNIGVAYAAKGLIDKCIEHCKRAAELKPDFEEAHFNLGVGYHEKGLLGKALKSFENTIKIRPDHYEASRYIKHILNNDLRASATESQG
jgi:tetratricopeptide (TPR) repeat protein